MPLRTKLQIALTLLTAAGAAVVACRVGSASWPTFGFLLFAILLSSGLKVGLPTGDGSMSLNFPFILLAVVQLSPLQAMLLTGLSVAAQCRIRVRKLFTAVQIGFNVANAMIATACAWLVYTGLHRVDIALAPALAVASLAYFLWNTIGVATVIATSSRQSPFALWRDEFLWYLPFYIVGAIFAAMASWMRVRFGWPTAMLLIPAVYTLYRAYMAQVSRLKERQQYLEDTEALHHRTIEGLAMAIEAKDQDTHDHLFRVRQYVKAVGETLGLSQVELQALHTAAFLHDIGKLAIPEHIINKPGKLTPEEFEKMKIHPVVGADILERVRFPYPVVPIVRSHHEWWNGTGYPDGLRGTDIPIGARVLTVVDCYDALVSDRPYRKGMSSQQAMSIIKSMAGKQFDPEIVRTFEQCHEASEIAAEHPAFTPLNTEVAVWRGIAPGAGYEAGSEEATASKPSRSAEDDPHGHPPSGITPLALIAAATQEAQGLFEMSQSLGNSLTPGDMLAVLASRLHRLIPFELCAVYLKNGDALDTRFLNGEHSGQFSATPIQLGEGISGWVAQTGRAILNGNAAVEPGTPIRPDGSPAFRGALSVPLLDLKQHVFGVLTLYAVKADSFQRDHLRVLQAMESKLSLSLQNALQFPLGESDSETDFLTGLPNARHLFLQLEAELEHCRKAGTQLMVAVCDLNAFKQVNDRRGHLAGNRLLSLIAEAFKHGCEPSQTAARMGGDEFVFLLPGVDEVSAPARIDNIVSAVAAGARRAGHSMNVTASVGAAFFPGDGSTAEELLALADRRMYLEKQLYYSKTTSLSVEPRASSPALIACNE